MRTYSVSFNNISVASAITLIQIAAGANNSIRLIAGYIQQTGTTTNAQQRIQLIRKTAAATVTSFTPVPFNPSDSASAAVGGAALTGVNASAEGTNAATPIYNDAFSLLTGWWWKPIPEEYVEVKGGGIIGLVLPSLTTNPTVFTGELVYQEFG